MPFLSKNKTPHPTIHDRIGSGQYVSVTGEILPGSSAPQQAEPSLPLEPFPSGDMAMERFSPRLGRLSIAMATGGPRTAEGHTASPRLGRAYEPPSLQTNQNNTGEHERP